MILDRTHPKVKMNIRLKDLNPHLMCVLCGGYYIDATTIIECLHSFCRSCIVKHLESSKYCPICEVMVHKTKPLTSIRRDKTLQDIVYKLVPGLYAKEMLNRRQFYKDRPHYIKPDDVDFGSDTLDDNFLTINRESCAIALRYHNTVADDNRFLKCPIGVTIKHLQKLIFAKFGLLPSDSQVDILLGGDPLQDHLTLRDITSLYNCKTKEPLELTYIIYEYASKSSSKEISKDINFSKKELNSVKEDETKNLEVIEKEVQLQITETGLMKISDVDSRHVIGFSDLKTETTAAAATTTTATTASATTTTMSAPLVVVAPQTVVVEKHGLSPAIAPASAPIPEPTTETIITNIVPAPKEKKEVTMDTKVPEKVEEKIKILGQKRPSVDKEPYVVPAKRPSIEKPRIVQDDKICVKESANNVVQIKPISNSNIKMVEEKVQPENQSAGKEVPKIGFTSAVNDSAPMTKEKKGDDLKREQNRVMQLASHDEDARTSKPSVSDIRSDEAVIPNKIYKPISRTTPQIWQPVITKEKLRPTLLKNSGSTQKPNKIYKMRPIPRYLGNPASGIKPMYSNGLPPASPPIPPPTTPRTLIDLKTQRPAPKEEKKAIVPLMTSPFIPRDNHFLLPDPKTTQPVPVSPKLPISPPAFHKSLPPCVSHFLTQHNTIRSVKSKEESRNCDSRPDSEPSASSSNKDKEEKSKPQHTTVMETQPDQQPTKCIS